MLHGGCRRAAQMDVRAAQANPIQAGPSLHLSWVTASVANLLLLRGDEQRWPRRREMTFLSNGADVLRETESLLVEVVLQTSSKVISL